MNTASPLWLVVERGALAGTSLRLSTEAVVIGRERGSELRMDAYEDRLVSARHARLTPTRDGWLLEDLGSRNGTLLNGEVIQGSRRVRSGDRIQLGNTGPVVRVTADPASVAATPPRHTPTTRTERAYRGRRSRLLVGGLAVAGVAAAFTFWLGRDGSGALSGDGSEAPADAATTAADAPGGTPSTAPAESDTTAARQSREIAALREQIDDLTERIRRSESDSDSLRIALDEAQARGASDAEIRELESRLQNANAALRRQQLAASLDFEAIGAAVRPATAQIFAEFEGRHVVVATAFGVDEDGRLLTNRHVVRDEAGRALLRIGIRYPGHEGVVPAHVVAASPGYDIALVELSEPPVSSPAVAGFNTATDTLAEGTPLAISGFPLGGGDPGAGRGPQPLLSAGVLMGRSGGFLEIEGYGRVGASGSPILDGDGRVVGLLLGGRIDDEGGERLYALPASRVTAFLRSVSAAR